jgi:hypothetical protein
LGKGSKKLGICKEHIEIIIYICNQLAKIFHQGMIHFSALIRLIDKGKQKK